MNKPKLFILTIIAALTMVALQIIVQQIDRPLLKSPHIQLKQSI